MWYLTHLHGPSKLDLQPNVKYTVGRKDVDLLLTNDSSISRNHAFVIVKYNPECQPAPFEASLVDVGSMVGTFIQTSPGEWKKLLKNTPHQLTSGDMIRFGLQSHIWQIHYKKIVTTTSNINGKKIKDDLKKNLSRLGGQVKSAWGKECTHLTMDNITLTVKAVCAMASGCPIVTSEYWKCYAENVAISKSTPDYKAFMPPVVEPNLNTADITFAIVDTRKNMFVGKLFVLATMARLKELEPMIIAAGGTAVDLQSSGLSIEQLSQPHVIVVHFICNPSQEPASHATYIKALNHLHEKGLRAIPESEIGLAVLKSSMEKHCNPAYSFENSLIGTQNVTSASALSRTTVLDLTSQVVAYDTQEIRDKAQSTQMHRSRNVIIPDSETTALSSSFHSNLDSFNKQPSLHHTSNVIPTKPRENLTSNDNLFGSKVNKKRTREPEKVDDHPPTPRMSASSRRKNSVFTNIEPDKHDDDCFQFPNSKKTKSSKQIETMCDTSFDFPQLTTSKTVRVNQTLTAERLPLVPSTSLEYQKTLDESEDMFADFDTDTCIPKKENPSPIDRKPLLSTEFNGTETSAKRKQTADIEEEMCMSPVKRPTLSRIPPAILAQGLATESTSVSNHSMVSLQGFINASDIKKECSNYDDLANEVLDLVLIETVPLVVVRRCTTPISQIGLDETDTKVKNFKKFRKVQPSNKPILPRIIGGRDLSSHFDDQQDNWDLPMSSDEHESDQDLDDQNGGWSFPTYTNKVGRPKKAARRNSRK